MQQRLSERWYGEAGPSLLQPLGWLYGAAMRLRRRAYESGLLESQRVGKPVIVVGNLTAGGTGKTPLVAWLAKQLSDTGLRVGIVSRGYGRHSRDLRVVHADSAWREVGDEPLLLRELSGCDTIVARDRSAAARALIARGADVVLADDGLQHLRLARDFDIVVIDGARGFGNGRLLPAGPLREPASRLRQVDLVVVNGIPEHQSLTGATSALGSGVLRMTLSGQEARRVDGQDAPRPLSAFRGDRVHAVAGIGNPQRFFRALREQGLDPIEHPFGDHHAFRASEVQFADGRAVLMTQKDAVKCREFAHPLLWHVPVVARFEAADARALLDRVRARIAAVGAHTGASPEARGRAGG